MTEPVTNEQFEQFVRAYLTRFKDDVLDYVDNGVRARLAVAPVVVTPIAATPTAWSSYQLGLDSKKKLEGVHPMLVEVVNRAITATPQDFCVYEGVRTPARQAKLVQQGYSQTTKSKHLVQSDGFGHAVDLVPWINGHPVWDWNGCYRVALAVDEAATTLGFADKIRWGGVWDKTLAQFGGDESQYRLAVEAYAARHPGKDFLDGPHFEIVG